MPGPIPMRSDQLSRKHNRQSKDRRPDIKRGELRPVDQDMFQPDPDWLDFVRNLWAAALSSGQAGYYQNSDLAILWIACNELDQMLREKGEYRVNRDTGERYYVPPRRAAMHIKTVMDMLSSLLLTEGERRRARLELDAPPEGETKDQRVKAKVASMQEHLRKKA